MVKSIMISAAQFEKVKRGQTVVWFFHQNGDFSHASSLGGFGSGVYSFHEIHCTNKPIIKGGETYMLRPESETSDGILVKITGIDRDRLDEFLHWEYFWDDAPSYSYNNRSQFAKWWDANAAIEGKFYKDNPTIWVLFVKIIETTDG